MPTCMYVCMYICLYGKFIYSHYSHIIVRRSNVLIILDMQTNKLLSFVVHMSENNEIACGQMVNRSCLEHFQALLCVCSALGLFKFIHITAP